jgi:hypothetical protein
MTRDVVRVRGSFVGLIDDPRPVTTVQPQPDPQPQVVAVKPAVAVDALARQSRLSRRLTSRRINELLSAR